MLFPKELEGKVATAVTGHNDKLTVELEEVGPRMDRFIHNLDTDEEIPDSDDKIGKQKKKQRPKDKARRDRGSRKDSRPSKLKGKGSKSNSTKPTIAYAERLEKASERLVPWTQGDEDTCPNDWAEGCDCLACQAAGESILAAVKQNVEEMKSDDEDADSEDEPDSDFDE